MPFSSADIEAAWKRAKGKCQCRRKSHGHYYVRCNKQLVWKNRGREGRGKWEANHRLWKRSGGSDVFSNCEIICWDCHKKTLSKKTS
ncbi:MAG: HNH endonuclease [Chloroflexi bacterium]|nr:HNH endonuclease [Chloroflexota bacterium]